MANLNNASVSSYGCGGWYVSANGKPNFGSLYDKAQAVWDAIGMSMTSEKRPWYSGGCGGGYLAAGANTFLSAVYYAQATDKDAAMKKIKSWFFSSLATDAKKMAEKFFGVAASAKAPAKATIAIKGKSSFGGWEVYINGMYVCGTATKKASTLINTLNEAYGLVDKPPTFSSDTDADLYLAAAWAIQETIESNRSAKDITAQLKGWGYSQKQLGIIASTVANMLILQAVVIAAVS